MAALPAVKSGSAGAITWGESLLPPAAWASGADRTARPRNAAESRRKPGRKAVMVGILDTLRSIPARTMGPPPSARPPPCHGEKAVGAVPVGGQGQPGAGLYTLHGYSVPPDRGQGRPGNPPRLPEEPATLVAVLHRHTTQKRTT